MGLFDRIEFEGGLPEILKPFDGGFETRSLGRMMETYSVTKEGCLIRHTLRYQKDASCAEGFDRHAPPVKVAIDPEFHGDVVLTALRGNHHSEYVLRFTQGALEWMRPLESLSEEQQNIAMARSLDG